MTQPRSPKVIPPWFRGARAVMTLAAAAGCLPGPASDPSLQPVVSTTLLRAHTRFLADDLLAGRGTGSIGLAAAARYIESSCRRIGLDPIGPHYSLSVPLERVEILSGTTLHIRSEQGSEMTLEEPDDFVLAGVSPGGLRGFDGFLRFVGDDAEILTTGVEAPFPHQTIAVTNGVVSREALEQLDRRGARGVIQLFGDAEAFARIQTNLERRGLIIADSTVESSFFPRLPVVVAGPHAARRIANVLPASAREARLVVETSRLPVPAENIGCRLPGSVVGDSAIVLTAHYDHLGIGTPTNQDSIFNGFSDNAAGVAALLAIGEAMKKRTRPLRHSVLFLFMTAEESGLLGSDYFVSASPWPLESIVGVINLDAGAPPARPWSWQIAGGENSRLGAIAVDVALGQGWSATTSSARPNSDYYPFWRKGVESIFIIPGPGKFEGISADSSESLRLRWDRYHQVDDEWSHDFPFEGLGRYASYAYHVALAVDGSVRVGAMPRRDRDNF